MAEILDIAQKLSGAGLATLLFIILFGSYKGIWVWGRQLDEAKLKCSEELREAKDKGAEWQRMALQGVGLAESSVHIAKVRERE